MREILDKTLKFKGTQFSVYQVSKKKGNDTVKRDLILRADGVVIIPIDSNGDVYLLKEFCIGASNPVISVPGGKIDKNENTEKAALRELYEETGIVASTLIPIHKTYSTPSIMKRRLFIYLALDLSEPKINSDVRDSDIIEILKMPIDEAIELLKQDFVSDSVALGYLLLAKEHIIQNMFKQHEI